MATTTTRTDQVKRVLGRLLRDEEAQGQLRTAATRLQEAGARANALRPSKAVEDKKVYAKLREALTSLTKAGRSLRSEPEPEPTRRGRKLVLLAAVAGAVAFAIKRRSDAANESDAAEFNNQASAPTAAAPAQPQPTSA
jgi:hypothetical protein